jgi:hypothetical protein
MRAFIFIFIFLYFYILREISICALRESIVRVVEAVITAPATSPADFQKNGLYDTRETTATVVP